MLDSCFFRASPINLTVFTLLITRLFKTYLQIEAPGISKSVFKCFSTPSNLTCVIHTEVWRLNPSGYPDL